MRFSDPRGATLSEMLAWARELVGQLRREFDLRDGYTLRSAELFRKRAVAPGIAAAGTDQASATPIVRDLTEITTCAAGVDDGLLLPSAGSGMQLTVANTTADDAQLWPWSGETVDGLGADTPITLPAGKCALMTCFADKAWRSLIGA